MANLTRTSRLTPGYDCIRHPCGKRGCGTNPGSSHGICSDQWCFVVSDGHSALTLEVSSGKYPDSVPATVKREPEGATLTIHSPVPLHEGNSADECERIPGGKCYSDGWFGAARDMFLESGAPTFEQPEKLWLALEAWFAENVAPRVAEAVAAACPTCGQHRPDVPVRGGR